MIIQLCLVCDFQCSLWWADGTWTMFLEQCVLYSLWVLIVVVLCLVLSFYLT